MKIAVIGAGNGGAAMAAHLVLKGYSVALYDKFPGVLEGIQKEGGIHLKGTAGEGFAPLAVISTDLEEVTRGAGLVMVVLPAFAHRDFAENVAPFLEQSQIIVLHPGRTGGALECKKAIGSTRPGLDAAIAEAQTLLYASRRTGPAEATIYGIKKRVEFAVLPEKSSTYVADILCAVFPEFVPVNNVLETSLLNLGAIFHPAPTILNSARIEGTRGDFEYYHQGITPAVGRILEKIDEERMTVAGALGVSTKSAREWLKDVYGAVGSDIYSAVQANKVYAGIKAPGSLDTRYISEDVPMSLVPISQLGRLAGVHTPTIDMIIDLASIIHNRDYRREGRTLERMGIDGMTVEEVIKLVS